MTGVLPSIDEMRDFLSSYDSEPVRIMEVCGSHTAAIHKNGIPGMLSPRISLLSGPGCPVCVTPSSYVDRLLELAEEGSHIVTFGDMMRIPGSRETLADISGRGKSVTMVYSPFDVIPMAEASPDTDFVFAAVGFETTTPVYALLMDRLLKSGISNVRLLCALKTMPEVITYLMESDAKIDGFIAPGHVSVVTGSGIFEPIAQRFSIPFAVSGFEGVDLLRTIYTLVRDRGNGVVRNLYPSVVSREGNTSATALIDKYFEKDSAQWRGMGEIPGSGRYLREEYTSFDAGSRGLVKDEKVNPACRCDQVLMGKCAPSHCPLFGKVCTPLTPQGACMVSEEGSCHSYFVS